MNDRGLAGEDLEAAYALLAEGVDRAGAKEALFLAKLALVLAQRLGNLDELRVAIDTALRDLD